MNILPALATPRVLTNGAAKFMVGFILSYSASAEALAPRGLQTSGSAGHQSKTGFPGDDYRFFPTLQRELGEPWPASFSGASPIVSPITFRMAAEPEAEPEYVKSGHFICSIPHGT